MYSTASNPRGEVLYRRQHQRVYVRVRDVVDASIRDVRGYLVCFGVRGRRGDLHRHLLGEPLRCIAGLLRIHDVFSLLVVVGFLAFEAEVCGLVLVS